MMSNNWQSTTVFCHHCHKPGEVWCRDKKQGRTYVFKCRRYLCKHRWVGKMPYGAEINKANNGGDMFYARAGGAQIGK